MPEPIEELSTKELLVGILDRLYLIPYKEDVGAVPVSRLHSMAYEVKTWVEGIKLREKYLVGHELG